MPWTADLSCPPRSPLQSGAPVILALLATLAAFCALFSALAYTTT
ncbi:hypothetical protein [Streptomyces sp. NPDC005091]